MENIKSIILRYADTGKKLGGESTNLAADNLQKELMDLKNRNRIFFWCCIVMVIILFMLSLFFVLYNLNQPEKIQLLFGATGISILGLIYYMNKLWKDINSSDLLITLVTTLDKEAINSVLVALLNNLYNNK
jgi:hypothetical protein